MSTFKGRLFLVKTWLGSANTSNTAQSTPVLYARTADLSLSQEEVDVSTKATSGWKELGADMGLKSLTLSCEGVYNNTAVEIAVAERAVAGNVSEYMIVSESGSYWKGPFFITEYARSGTYNDAETFSMTLSSAGVVTYANTAG
jgi:predicted secreted protein